MLDQFIRESANYPSMADYCASQLASSLFLVRGWCGFCRTLPQSAKIAVFRQSPIKNLIPTYCEMVVFPRLLY